MYINFSLQQFSEFVARKYKHKTKLFKFVHICAFFKNCIWYIKCIFHFKTQLEYFLQYFQFGAWLLLEKFLYMNPKYKQQWHHLKKKSYMRYNYYVFILQYLYHLQVILKQKDFLIMLKQGIVKNNARHDIWFKSSNL